MSRVIAALFLSSAISFPAWAEPPVAGSDDYDMLMPYASWISGRSTNFGGLCCSVSDCRVVKWRTSHNGYEAFIAAVDDRGYVKFPHGPNEWLGVPDEVVKREFNPTGQAIACWSNAKPDDAGFYCFFLPEMG